MCGPCIWCAAPDTVWCQKQVCHKQLGHKKPPQEMLWRLSHWQKRHKNLMGVAGWDATLQLVYLWVVNWRKHHNPAAPLG